MSDEENVGPFSAMGGKRRRGRRTKLTPEVHAKIVKLIRMGNFRETAAASVGVDSCSLRRWMYAGAEGRQPYKAFSDEMDVAEAEAEALGLAAIVRAGKSDWKATAWRLERRHPDRWAARNRTELSGPDGGPVQVRGPVIMLPSELGNEECVGLPTGKPGDTP